MQIEKPMHTWIRDVGECYLKKSNTLSYHYARILRDIPWYHGRIFFFCLLLQHAKPCFIKRAG